MSRKGFSLMEVNMAILIAAGGLLSLFALFPTSLKQSEMSSEDLYQSTYASSVFQMLAANIATISNLEEEWEDEKEFWKIATEGTGLPSTLKEATSLKKDNILYELLDGHTDEKNNVWYVGTDFSSGSSNMSGGDPALPNQYVLRLYKKKSDSLDPAVYVVSFVSSSFNAPVVFQNNPVYSVEFTFHSKVWCNQYSAE